MLGSRLDNLYPTGSKLEAGIHKLAATLTKAGKGKTFDKQVTSPTELAPADKGLYEDLSPTHEKTTLARQVSFDENVEVIAEQSEKTEATKSDENGRKASREELEVEAKVQQKIEESKRVNGSLKQVKKQRYSMGSFCLSVFALRSGERNEFATSARFGFI